MSTYLVLLYLSLWVSDLTLVPQAFLFDVFYTLLLLAFVGFIFLSLSFN
jgi:hypothetical protein